jgi:hypothetical protein
MANPVQLNLSPFLQMHYQALSAHPGSPLKEYHNKPEVLDRIMTVYVNNLKKTVPKTTACGGTLAFAAAWIVGLGVPGMVLSSLGGAAGGAAAGVATETVKLAMEIRLSKDYIKWKNSIEGPILENFKQILEDHRPFEEFLCYITRDFPEIPVRDSFNRLYNQEAIFKWIDENGTNPYTREPMTREDVSFCSRFATELKDELDSAFGNPEFIGLLGRQPDEMIAGFKSIITSIIKNHNNVIFKKARQEMDKAEAQGLSPVEIIKIYQIHIADIIDDIPELEKPKGLGAILTIESIKDIDSSLFKEAQAVACEVVSKLKRKNHEE